MRRCFSIIAAIAACFTLNAQTPAQKYVELLKGSQELKDAVWGVYAVKMKGDTVACWNSGSRMLPASNTKVLTTGAVLSELGADYRFRTRIAIDGKVDEGVLKGDVYILGGGDPTIGARDSISFKPEETFGKWMDVLRAAGIRKVQGHVIGDGRFFDGEFEPLSWQFEDLGYDYAPGGDGLCFFENIQQIRITPGLNAGDPVKVVPVYPLTPWVELRTPCVTAPAGTGNDLVYVATNMVPVAEMRGTIACDRKPTTHDGSNKFGSLTCAYYFYKYLADRGFVVTEGPADVDMSGQVRDFSPETAPYLAQAVKDLKVIGESLSPTLGDIARKTNHDSDNFYAETLLRILAREKTGSACYDSCSVARSRAFARMGIDDSNVRIVDGSGLSRENYVSPEFFVSFLKAMRTSPAYDAFFASLPQPGRGTLTTRMASAPASVRSRVHMKSGSMGGVRCFSGYIEPSTGKAEDTIVFSFLTNNTLVPVSRINFILDKLIALSAESN